MSEPKLSKPADDQSNAFRPFSFRAIDVDGLTPENFQPLHRQVRILYVFLVALFVPLMAILVLIQFVTPAEMRDNYRLLVVFCTLLNIFALLLLRYGEMKAASQTLVAMTMFAPWISLGFAPGFFNGDMVPLLYFIFPIMLSTLFLNFWETVIVALAQYLLLVYVVFSTGLQAYFNASGLLVFMFLLALLAVLISYVREKNIKQLAEQTMRLEKTRRNLQQQSVLDPLTGLYNRRYLEKLMDEELRFAEENAISLGFLMLDLDHFKQINESYGHDVGDRILREIGQSISKNIRQTDYLVRHGGDEMILVMPGAASDVAERRAEQFRKTIEELVIPLEGQVLDAFTVSIGVTAYPEHGRTKEELTRSADEALQQAKASGRNRVAVAKRPTRS